MNVAVTQQTVLYAGTFDPVHFGHVDVVRRAAHLFPRVIVGVIDRPSKSSVFSPAERVEMFRQAIANLPNVEVHGYSGLTVAYARTVGAAAIVRGIRAAPDFEYEHQLTDMNRHIAPDIETVFLVTDSAHSHLSSSLIKEVAWLGVDVTALVPPNVAAALQARAPATSAAAS
jgi:pantetheine-phosphate adenylyltransferase